MIDWDQLHVTIDNQAKDQFDRYFQDLEKILDDQNLTIEKRKIISELENHIRDYIIDNKINTVTYEESLKIISEFGPPDDFDDSSSLPGILDQFTKLPPEKKDSKAEIILCNNCNAKNNSFHEFCTNCGERIIFQKDSPPLYNGNTLDFILKTKKQYSLSMLSVYLMLLYVVCVVFQFNDTFKMFEQLLIISIMINELITIPFVILLSFSGSSLIKESIGDFLVGYVSKALIIIFSIAIEIFSYDNTAIAVFLVTTSLFVLPILVTKLLFFSSFSLNIYRISNLSLSDQVKNLNLAVVCAIVLLNLFIVPDSGNFLQFAFNINISMISFLILESLYYFGRNSHYSPKIKLFLSQKSSSINEYKLSFIQKNKNVITVELFSYVLLIIILWFFQIIFIFNNANGVFGLLKVVIPFLFILLFVIVFTIEYYCNIKASLTNIFMLFSLASFLLSTVFITGVKLVSQENLTFDPSTFSYLPNIRDFFTSNTIIFDLFVILFCVVIPLISIFLIYKSNNFSQADLVNINFKRVSTIFYAIEILSLAGLFLNFIGSFSAMSLIIYSLILGIILLIKPMISFLNFFFILGTINSTPISNPP